MSKPKSITDDLRSQLGALEGRAVELLSERDEFSYSALVDRDTKAINLATSRIKPRASNPL